jgi:hypothetical protein
VERYKLSMIGKPGITQRLKNEKSGTEQSVRYIKRSLFLHSYISKMYFMHWKPPGVSARMWSVNLDVSISGDYWTLGGHPCRPLE